GSPACAIDDGKGWPYGSKAMWSYRADVLRFFPRIKPSDPTQPVQVLATGAHEITLPDMGKSRSFPSTLGAALVLVYRVAGYDAATGYQAPRQPLRSIVIYDGGYTLNDDSKQLKLPMQGFYEASRTAPDAHLALVVADGESNKSERV